MLRKRIQNRVNYSEDCVTAQAIPVYSENIVDIAEYEVQHSVAYSSLGLQISPKVIGFYLLWVAIYFITIIRSIFF